MSSKRLIHIAVLTLIVAIAAGEFYQYRLFYHDDAFISLRYVRNFLHGDGLVWNAGERVEGYSNFLLVIILAALGRLGLDLVFAGKLVGVLSYLFVVAFVYVRSHRLRNSSDDNRLWLIPVVISATALPLIIWSMGGLETALFALLITVGALTFADSINDPARPFLIPGIVFGLASLCRPDGILFVFLGLAMGLIAGYVRTRRFDVRIVGFLAGTLILIVPHLIFRWSYYHDLVPNTYYVKVAHLGDVLPYGWTYLKEYFLAPPYLPALLITVTIIGAIRQTLNFRSVWLMVCILAYIGYVVSIGGDHMPAFRLLAPLIPMAGWLLYELFVSSRMIQKTGVSAAISTLVFLLAVTQLVFPAEKCRRAQIMDGAAFLGSQVGKHINDNWPEGSLVALNTAGSTPYYAPKLRFIDMLGLNDTTIARRKNPPLRTKMQEWPGHRKGDGAYILSRRPDYIIIGPSNGDFANDFPWFLSDYELSGSAEFARYYQPVRAVIPVNAPGFDQYTESSLGALRVVYYERRK